MDNYLTTLYFKLFKIREEEKRLRGIQEFPDDNATIRNDQKISAKREQNKMLCELIDEYQKVT